MGKRKVRLKDLGKVLKQAIQMAEVLFPDAGSGAEKREWVVDLVNEKLDIPFLNERQESQLLGILIDVLVDLVLNATDG
jgi:hypothetical protein|tara:strand:+ start:261 stop:497 length:237 start_codon:yes stop_codon:yes gene_type:complete